MWTYVSGEFFLEIMEDYDHHIILYEAYLFTFELTDHVCFCPFSCIGIIMSFVPCTITEMLAICSENRAIKSMWFC